MAGIFTDVSSDIQKLQQLKAEIESVKKALKSINIKVDIDIAKGLEGQLKALTDQYNALVSRISEAEGKILLSTKRINDAAEKIIQAQEKVAKSIGASAQPGSAGTGTNTVETASIQAQAKAYEELRIEIDDVLGTRDANIKRMVEEMNAIRLINAEINKINKLQGESSSLSSAQQKRLEQLNNSLLTHKTVLSEVRQTLNNNAKLDNAAATSMNGLSQSLSRMRIAYRELTEEERNSPFGKELLTSINQADAKIKELDATIGNHQRNVGNYKSQWNGLNVSIQQLGRELPSLAYGPKVFFSAISNNLSILADEIKRTKDRIKKLKEAGEEVEPLWKQLAKGVFSWQTALTVGITLLTLYGDKIVGWVGSLFTAKKALSGAYQSLEDYQKKVGETSGSVISTLERLSQGWKRLGGDIDAQKKFILENKDAIDSMGVSVNDAAEAERLFNTNKDTFIMGLLQRAKAAATMELAAEEYKKAVQKMMEADAKSAEGVSLDDRLKSWFVKSAAGEDLSGTLQKADLSPEAFAKEKEEKMREEAESLFKSGTELVMKFAQFSEEEQKILESIGIKTTKTMIDGSIEAIEAVISLKQQSLKKVTNPKDYKRIEAEIKAEQARLKAITGEKDKISTSDKQLKQKEQLAEQLLSLRRKNKQDEINLMKEGSEKKLAQIDLDYQKELDAIEKQRDEWNKSQKGKLTDEQETQLFTSEENAFKIYEKNVKEVNEAKLEADRKAWQEYFIEFGNYQEKRKNLIQQYDDEIAKLQMDSPEYASKTAEKGQALEQLDEQFGKSTKAMADLFEDASNKSVFAIQSIIDKYETLVKYMSGTKKSDGTDVTLDELKSVGFTDSDIERLENGEIKIKDVIDAIKGLKNELKEKSPWQSFRTELGKGIDTIKNADGDTQKLGQGITDIGNAVTSFIPALSEFGSNIANIFGVDDSKITGIIDAVGGLGQTAVGVGQIMSGDIFGGAMSAVSGISSIVSALDGLFGSDYSHYNAMKERYDTLNEIWDELISKKKEYIDISYGTEALKAGQEALDVIKKSQDAQRNLARTLAQSGASAGSHSIAYRQNAALGSYASELYRYVRQNGNYNDITNALLGASAEQLQKVKEQMPELWAGLDGDFREHLNNIISGAEQAKEVLEQMKEAVAGISFDEFRSGYIDLLSDLDSTNEDFADNFEKYLQKSIFESLLANKYKERIQALYDTWVEYGKDGLTPDEVQKLRDMQEQLSESLLAERDKIMSDFGFTTNGSESKSSTSKGFSTMSQDTGEELNGRFTALQIAGEEIKNQNIIQSQSFNLLTTKADAILSINTETRNIADDARDLIAQSYLELVQISENTGNSAKYLKDIKVDIAAVKKNTAGLAL